ncbi:hypothetical protein ACFYNL_34915 [Streptomyces sp. NPDC007808]|uniref:hypothetical protein n=1 Tax=Streptomyces sp. NPDC007808 TaxID=3364779 RepID=UPI0036AEF83C
MSGLTYFGAEADAQLQRWQNSRRSLAFAEELPDGGSGARLAFVYHEGDADHRQQKLLLKLCADEEGATTEPNDLEAAWSSGPAFHQGGPTFDFPRRRLIRQVYPPIPVGNTWLMFLQVALDERARHPLQPLSVVEPRAAKAKVAAAVIHAVLAEWNPDPRADHEMAASTFLQKALGHRADPESRLSRAAEQLLGPDRHSPMITLPGRPDPVPNPTPFCYPHALDGLKPPTVALGRAHYDLHPGNIMVATQPSLRPDSFRLVDLSRFQETGLLLRDPVHLMLCLVCDYLPGLDEQASRELAHILLVQDEDSVDPNESLLPGGLLATVRLLRTASDPWRQERDYAHSDWHPQYLLALQACALMFVTRRTLAREQLWFLGLAADACAAFHSVARPLSRSVPAHEPARDMSAAGPAVLGDPAAGLPPELQAELVRHERQLRHLRARCGDPRFDSVLTDNLRIVVNRCARLADLADDGPPTEAALTLQRQASDVLEAADALAAERTGRVDRTNRAGRTDRADGPDRTGRGSHDGPAHADGAGTARDAFVAALTDLLEHPGRIAQSPPYGAPDIARPPRPTPAEPPTAKVLRLPLAQWRGTGAAAELAALLKDIDRLPTDASGPRTAYLARRLCDRAARLANVVTGLDATLLRNQLVESGELMLRFDSTTAPEETLEMLRRAGRRLRAYGHELWPHEID